MNLVVIGAGVTGVTTAYSLLRKGHGVTLIDRHRYPAMATSYANGGQLSASNAEVWNNWPTVLNGARWMLSASAPLLMDPRPSYHKYSWIAEFLAQIPNHAANTIRTVQLALEARRQLLWMSAEEGVEFDYRAQGLLHLYYTRRAFDRAAVSNRLLEQGGLHRIPVTPEEIASIEPTIAGEFYGGFYTPSDASGDIHKFTTGMAQACERRGARLLLETNVEQIVPERHGAQVHVSMNDGARGCIEADAIVVCAGTDSRRLAASVGDRVNIYPVKGYSITVNLNGGESRAAAPSVCLLDESAKIVTSRLGPDRLRVAGTAEFNGFNADIRADRIEPLIAWCRRLFPAVPTSAVVPWAGLRPMTPTMLPRVGAGKHPRIFYNTGHGHLGWTLAGATSQLVVEQIEQVLS